VYVFPHVIYRTSGFYTTDSRIEKHNLDYDGPRGPEDLEPERKFKVFT
jgi:hypothetical protein